VSERPVAPYHDAGEQRSARSFQSCRRRDGKRRGGKQNAIRISSISTHTAKARSACPCHLAQNLSLLHRSRRQPSASGKWPRPRPKSRLGAMSPSGHSRRSWHIRQRSGCTLISDVDCTAAIPEADIARAPMSKPAPKRLPDITAKGGRR
jgi:hypothetical protein